MNKLTEAHDTLDDCQRALDLLELALVANMQGTGREGEALMFGVQDAGAKLGRARNLLSQAREEAKP